jgi:hypothetical protein
MRTLIILLALSLAGCGASKATVYRNYVIEGGRDTEIYFGNDAVAAYDAELRYIEYVRNLQRENAPIDIPYTGIFTWSYARLGLLAEHLGKKKEAAYFWRLAVANARKADPNGGETKTGETALRSALDQMDTPDRIKWKTR